MVVVAVEARPECLKPPCGERGVPEGDKEAYAAAVPRREPGLSRAVQLCKQSEHHRKQCEHRDVYVFGVFTGNSMRQMSIFFNNSGVRFRRIIGFDSFSGLPDGESAAMRKGYMVNWKAGEYSTSRVFGKNRMGEKELLGALHAKIDDSRARFVKGFYNESLTPSLPTTLGLEPALFIDMDCDIYSSTYQALEWMLTHGLIATGTILSYDDWGMGGATGQKLAHAQLLAKFPKVTARMLAGTNARYHPEFEMQVRHS